MTDKTAADRLWDFSLDIYRRRDVESACLSLQARCGVSVSLLLASIWLGLNGDGRMGTMRLESAAWRALEWHREFVEPLRALRRQLRHRPPAGLENDAERFRARLLEQELAAERMEQRLFLNDLDYWPPTEPRGNWRDAVGNAALLVRRSCPRPENEAVAAFVTVLAATCPHVKRDALLEATRETLSE